MAFSEIEPFPSAVLKHHYPNVLNWGDMTQYKTWPNADIDVLVGGTPCQSFSIAGLRKGLEDPRGNLMLTFLGIADRYRPKYIVWENVPGVLSSNAGRDFGSFLGALGELGYGWAYRVLDAQWFGVAQRRRRVFVVGCLGDQRSAAAVLFESESVSRNPAPSRKARKGVATDAEASVAPSCTDTVTAKWSKGAEALQQGAQDGGNCIPILMRQREGKDGGGKGPLISEEKSLTLATSNDQVLAFRDPSPTITSKMQGASGWAPYNEDAHLVGVQPTSNDQVLAQPVGGIPDVAETLIATDHKGPGHNRDHNFVAQPVAGFLPKQGSRAEGIGYAEEQSPTLRAGCDSYGIIQPVAFRETADCLTSAYGTKWNGNASADNGSLFAAQPLPFDTTQLTCPSNYSSPKPGDPCHPLAAGAHIPAVATTMQVRRLTPVECERLQGFPDNFTRIPWKKKPAEECPDGPRYKALGNSMAVPCMKWIGERINKQAHDNN